MSDTEKLREAIGSRDDYIKLLGEELGDMVGFLFVHGIQSQRVEAGKKARDRIAKADAALAGASAAPVYAPTKEERTRPCGPLHTAKGLLNGEQPTPPATPGRSQGNQMRTPCNDQSINDAIDKPAAQKRWRCKGGCGEVESRFITYDGKCPRCGWPVVAVEPGGKGHAD
jgi:hypothetical protein